VYEHVTTLSVLQTGQKFLHHIIGNPHAKTYLVSYKHELHATYICKEFRHVGVTSFHGPVQASRANLTKE
jgi:hypothetical protein